MKKILEIIPDQATKLYAKAISNDEVSGKEKASRSRNHVKHLMLFGIVAVILPEIAEASTKSFSSSNSISDVANSVKSASQGSFIKIILNVAGVAMSGMSLMLNKWGYLVMGVAVLVFTYFYFGYVNSNFS